MSPTQPLASLVLKARVDRTEPVRTAEYRSSQWVGGWEGSEGGWESGRVCGRREGGRVLITNRTEAPQYKIYKLNIA